MLLLLGAQMENNMLNLREKNGSAVACQCRSTCVLSTKNCPCRLCLILNHLSVTGGRALQMAVSTPFMLFAFVFHSGGSLKPYAFCFLPVWTPVLKGVANCRIRFLFLSILAAALHFWSGDLRILLATARTWLLTCCRCLPLSPSLNPLVLLCMAVALLFLPKLFHWRQNRDMVRSLAWAKTKRQSTLRLRCCCLKDHRRTDSVFQFLGVHWMLAFEPLSTDQQVPERPIPQSLSYLYDLRKIFLVFFFFRKG